jgi:dihydrodipicolinate synthase/N-acetylneuraminate lyase
MTTLSGVWLPIVTPFHDGAVDFASYERLIEHYIGLGVSGIFPLSTTGESPALDDDESEAIVARTVAVVAGRVPVFVGIGGNITAKTLKLMKRLEPYDYPGIVSPRHLGAASAAHPRRSEVSVLGSATPGLIGFEFDNEMSGYHDIPTAHSGTVR